MNLVNPYFKTDNYPNGDACYTLCFDGFEGVGNIDEDGDEFFYCVECEPLRSGWYNWKRVKYGYYWIFDKVYEDDHFEANIDDDEKEFVIQYMLERIESNKQQIRCLREGRI